MFHFRSKNFGSALLAVGLVGALVACGSASVDLDAPPSVWALAEDTFPGRFGILELDGASLTPAPGDPNSTEEASEVDCEQSGKDYDRQYAALIGMVEFHQVMRTPAWEQTTHFGSQASAKHCGGLVKPKELDCSELTAEVKKHFAELQKTDEWQKLIKSIEWTRVKTAYHRLQVGGCLH